jgi:hypothetical protein
MTEKYALTAVIILCAVTFMSCITYSREEMMAQSASMGIWTHTQDSVTVIDTIKFKR